MKSEKRVALITGANRGMGLEIARQLGQQGITVVLGSREEAKGRAAADALKREGIDAHTVKLDVTNPADVAALPAYFETTFGRLDILVNNAGINPGINHGDDNSPEAFRRTFEANVIAPWFITQALLPLLKASPAGRIVNHSSILGSISLTRKNKITSMVPYDLSKAALNMQTVLQANALAGTKIKVNAAHPGWVKTEMGGPNALLEPEEGAKTAVRLALLPEDGPTGGYFHMDEPMPW